MLYAYQSNKMDTRNTLNYDNNTLWLSLSNPIKCNKIAALLRTFVCSIYPFPSHPRVRFSLNLLHFDTDNTTLLPSHQQACFHQFDQQLNKPLREDR